ncbi:MAG: hypothetical protein NZ903_02530 [Candidatus Micrarchaeota archaeon]|nr:hypothetical protein [Candidatus Micrarchaeota archaeon]
MANKKIKSWEQYLAYHGRLPKEYKVLSQEGLFSEIPINEKIIIKEKKNDMENKEKNEKNSETEVKKEEEIKENRVIENRDTITIIHRKNFGIIEKNIYQNLDRTKGDRNDECVNRCRKGTLWVYYGYEFSRMAIVDNKLIIHEGFPDSLYDVLNEAEIYQLYVALYKGKWNRDFDSSYPAFEFGDRGAYAARLISYENIENEDFSKLMADLITHGEYHLRRHWNYDEIISNKKSNPYETTYLSLKERIGLIPEDDKRRIKKILKLKKPYLSTKRNNYLPGIDVYRISQWYNKNEDGTHVKKRDLPPNILKKIGFFVNPWLCADLIYDYMKKREQEWKKWNDNISINP